MSRRETNYLESKQKIKENGKDEYVKDVNKTQKKNYWYYIISKRIHSFSYG